MNVDRRGEVFENPVTGERAVVLTDPRTHRERVLVSHLYVEPGGRVAVKHRHPGLTERFRVITGRVGFSIGEETRELGPGEAAEVPPDTLHDWWQLGEETAELVVEVSPGDRFVELVGTFFGLARDGKVDGKGVPKPLQLAVSARDYADVMVVATPATISNGPSAPKPRTLSTSTIMATPACSASCPRSPSIIFA
jgi:mannose-6-phosphate isomerase-like protein (cupin superfamily)